MFAVIAQWLLRGVVFRNRAGGCHQPGRPRRREGSRRHSRLLRSRRRHGQRQRVTVERRSTNAPPQRQPCLPASAAVAAGRIDSAAALGKVGASAAIAAVSAATVGGVRADLISLSRPPPAAASPNSIGFGGDGGGGGRDKCRSRRRYGGGPHHDASAATATAAATAGEQGQKIRSPMWHFLPVAVLIVGGIRCGGGRGQNSPRCRGPAQLALPRRSQSRRIVRKIACSLWHLPGWRRLC